ncbi:MAG: hydrogenase iron-sulfur subunit [Deltaproteobacteria bacterium]|nr:hydrogenase iron-sulfur subunit [Deltaproteobacteria bacterium]
MKKFEPKIIAFCCQYCAYAAADLAGSMRLRYAPNIRIILVPCSGTIDVIHILRAIEDGADGVLVAGCLEGGCHFIEGNFKAKRRVRMAKDLVGRLGIEEERVEMFNLSSAEGPRFAEIANEMTERIKALGPSPLRRKNSTEENI